jgi:hypothetical protein
MKIWPKKDKKQLLESRSNSKRPRKNTKDSLRRRRLKQLPRPSESKKRKRKQPWKQPETLHKPEC